MLIFIMLNLSVDWEKSIMLRELCAKINYDSFIKIYRQVSYDLPPSILVLVHCNYT